VQKAITKYGLAAHLALLAVAPLFLFPFCGEAWTARTILWLTLLAAVWTAMEPSRRRDEMLHDARARVALSVARDPLFWFSLVLAGLAAVRWANGGVKMAYDAENAVWSLAEPPLPFLPGGVSGTGCLPFATALALVVLFQACRHALGKSARVVFLFSSSFLAGVAAFVAGVACACGSDRALGLSACPLTDASFAGSAFGLHLMGSMVALAGAFERKWKQSLPLLAVGIGGSAVGLYLFAPDAVILVYALGALLVLALALVYAQARLGAVAVAKCLAFLLVSSLLAVLFAMGAVPASVRDVRFAFLSGGEGGLLPEGFAAMRDALSGIAAKAWREHPWLGTGLGSFGLDIRFNATEADWALFPHGQVGALNGWWQMLAERGIAGTVLFAAPLFFLAWTFALRAAGAVKGALAGSRAAEGILSIHPACGLGVLAVAATAACGFVDHSFWRPETAMAAGAMFAMAGSAFPPLKKKSDGESETEK